MFLRKTKNFFQQKGARGPFCRVERDRNASHARESVGPNLWNQYERSKKTNLGFGRRRRPVAISTLAPLTGVKQRSIKAYVPIVMQILYIFKLRWQQEGRRAPNSISYST